MEQSVALHFDHKKILSRIVITSPFVFFQLCSYLVYVNQCRIGFPSCSLPQLCEFQFCNGLYYRLHIFLLRRFFLFVCCPRQRYYVLGLDCMLVRFSVSLLTELRQSLGRDDFYLSFIFTNDVINFINTIHSIHSFIIVQTNQQFYTNDISLFLCFLFIFPLFKNFSTCFFGLRKR